MVKSPKIYIRDSGLVHTLLRIDSIDDLLGHPVAGASWEGHVIETLIRAAPSRTLPYFYRTTAGAEIDFVLELPGHQRWAIEIKRSSAPRLGRGFHTAMSDLETDRAFVVHPSTNRYPKGPGIEAIGLREMAQELKTIA